MSQTCYLCKVKKPLDEFIQRKDGIYYQMCMVCNDEVQAKKLANPGKRLTHTLLIEKLTVKPSYSRLFTISILLRLSYSKLLLAFSSGISPLAALIELDLLSSVRCRTTMSKKAVA